MNHFTLIEKAFFLKKNPMFSSLELDLLFPISDKLILIEIDDDEIIFDIGENAYSMYLIAKGEVNIYGANKQKICTLGPGEVFGEESIFSGSPRAYKSYSQTKVKLLTLSQADLLALIHEYPNIATGFIEMYTKVTPFRPRLTK